MNIEKLKAAVRAAAPDGYVPVKHWIYADTAGAMELAIARFNAVEANGKKRAKQIRPFISDGNGGFVSRFPSGLRPILNLDKLAANPEAVVIVVEGEPKVDVLSEMFPDYVATCSSGGSCQAKNSDWSVFAGRMVYVWPDNNDAGLKYAAAVAELVPQAKVVNLPDWVPPDWDPADALPEGITVDDIALALATASRPSSRANGKDEHATGAEALGAATRKAVKAKLVSRCADDIVPEPVSWFWSGRIARGKHTCIAGEPGTGKSQVSVAIVAALTAGGHWPCGEGEALVSGSVIILSAEDGEADTIKPRLMAAGANCRKVHLVSAVMAEDGAGRRSFNLQADLDLLEREIERLGDVCLIVIDPISSYLGRVDSHKNADVRGVLEPIGEMAERLGVAVLSITHFSKAGIGTTTKALHRFIGSIAFVGAPRMAFAVIEDPDDPTRRLFLHAKNNLAAPPQGLAFRLEQTLIGDVDKRMFASHVKWEAEPVDMTADAAMAVGGGGEGEGKLEAAEEFIKEVLTPGEHVSVNEFNKQAEALGISKRTLSVLAPSLV